MRSRGGGRSTCCKFRLAYFRPASGLNEDLQRLHAANLFAVVRQLRFSERDEQNLDLALFLNGIPIFTAELKSPLNGQDVRTVLGIDHDRLESDDKFMRHLAQAVRNGLGDPAGPASIPRRRSLTERLSAS